MRKAFAHIPALALRLGPAAAVLSVALLVGCGGGEDEKVSLVSLIPPEAAVIKIDDHEVSGAWLRNFAVTQEVMARSALPGVPFEVNQHSLIRGARDMLTKINVVALEARRRGLEVTEAEISDKLSEEVSRFESTQEWKQRIEDSGMTPDERRKQIEIELLFDRYREEIVAPRAKEKHANEENARKFYEAHPELWKRPLRVELFHIHRTVARDAPESERERERAKIEEALERIEDGESFQDVAREISTEESALEGGELGWIDESFPVNEELREASLSLEKGEISDVIESSMGYHVFWARDREEAGQKPFEEVREDILERIMREALTIEMEKEIAELRAQSDIKYLDLTPFIGEEPEQEPGTPGEPGAPPPAPADQELPQQG